MSHSSHIPVRYYAGLCSDCLEDTAEEDHIKQLIEEGEPILPTTLWAAVNWHRPVSVDLLLSAGVDPNRRHAKAEEIMLHAQRDWLDRDPDRRFEGDSGELFPLHLAAWAPSTEERQEQAYRMVRSLLRHGADPYAIFASQLEEIDGDYDDYARRLFPGEETGQGPPPKGSCFITPWNDQRITDALNALPDTERATIIPSIVADEFGLRSVIHAILEESCLLKVFLDSPEFMMDLKLEHRSPQGRTLFLSACRNDFGADASLDKVVNDDRDLEATYETYDSDPRAAFPPGIYSAPYTDEAQPRTAIQALLSLGADPLATDNQGKNALHQLLEAHSGSTNMPPTIRQSLRHLISQFPALLNQPDCNGMMPIHTALRRLWKFTKVCYVWHYIDLDPPEDCVHDLIEAGADVHARDAQNNTVLHYLADSDLDSPNRGKGRRDLFYMLLYKYNCIAYINTPNNLGQTPIQILLGYSHRKDVWNSYVEGPSLKSWHPCPTTRSVDTELFAKLDEAGVDWMVRDKLGRTLLHGIAQTDDFRNRAQRRCRYLLQKGVDPLVCDIEGKTARDLAFPDQDIRLVRLLREYEEAAVRDQPHDTPDNGLEQ
ncbi:hypothetical protein ACHAQJ_005156 [Trichoderma viride]